MTQKKTKQKNAKNKCKIKQERAITNTRLRAKLFQRKEKQVKKNGQ